MTSGSVIPVQRMAAHRRRSDPPVNGHPWRRTHPPADVLSPPIPETCPPGEGASTFAVSSGWVAARRRLCRAAGVGASPHARLARQCEGWSGERRPEGAALKQSMEILITRMEDIRRASL